MLFQSASVRFLRPQAIVDVLLDTVQLADRLQRWGVALLVDLDALLLETRRKQTS